MALAFLKHKFPVIPDYEIHEKIAQRGAGSTYKGSHRRNGQKVIIKVISTPKVPEPDLLARWQKGCRAASELSHPNIVQVIGFSRNGTEAYVVMEYVEGMSLGERIKRDGRLAEDLAALIITQAAQALHFAHESGLIHRNVKPDNILVGENGQAKLTGFGLLKNLRAKNHLTDPNSILGTPQFMAPEQYHNPKNVDRRADLYSLAATLYVAVTGELPFGQCKSFTAVMEKALRGDITPPSAVVPSLSPEIDAAIRRGMNPEPGKRPANCLEFVRNLPHKKQEPSAPKCQAGEAGRSRPESRGSVRYPSGMGTFCAVNTFVHDALEQVQDTWPATVKNVSRIGLGLVLGRRLERNTTLTIELKTSDRNSPTFLDARVNRVQAQGHGHWFVGCEFLKPLSDEILRAFIQTD